jgi:hypothetical protein
MFAPRRIFPDPLEDGVQLDAGDVPLRDVLQSERDARHQLILATGDHTGVIPASVDVDDLQVFLDLA